MYGIFMGECIYTGSKFLIKNPLTNLYLGEVPKRNTITKFPAILLAHTNLGSHLLCSELARLLAGMGFVCGIANLPDAFWSEVRVLRGVLG
jgi:hypothetical protein